MTVHCYVRGTEFVVRRPLGGEPQWKPSFATVWRRAEEILSAAYLDTQLAAAISLAIGRLNRPSAN